MFTVGGLEQDGAPRAAPGASFTHTTMVALTASGVGTTYQPAKDNHHKDSLSIGFGFTAVKASFPAL